MDLSAPRGESVSPSGGRSVNRRTAGTAGPSSSGSSRLAKALRQRLAREGDRAAFDYLFRETSLEVLNQVFTKIRDEGMSEYLLDVIMHITSLLSSEAFTGIGQIRHRLKNLETTTRNDPAAARHVYDGLVESLGQHVFALGRRLHQIEQFMEQCPFTGSAEQMRGLYGQRVRDQAGDVRFLRLEVNRWVRRFVPLQRDLPSGGEGRDFLEGRISAVVDDLGLRMKEIEETLTAVVFEQVQLFDDTVTRPQFFRSDVENLLDLQRFKRWLGELVVRVRDLDQKRRPEQLERVKALLQQFHPKFFPDLPGIRESDRALFLRFAEQVRAYRVEVAAPANDPIQPFLLLLGDLMSHLSHRLGEPPSLTPEP